MICHGECCVQIKVGKHMDCQAERNPNNKSSKDQGIKMSILCSSKTRLWLWNKRVSFFLLLEFLWHWLVFNNISNPPHFHVAFGAVIAFGGLVSEKLEACFRPHRVHVNNSSNLTHKPYIATRGSGGSRSEKWTDRIVKKVAIVATDISTPTSCRTLEFAWQGAPALKLDSLRKGSLASEWKFALSTYLCSRNMDIFGIVPPTRDGL